MLLLLASGCRMLVTSKYWFVGGVGGRHKPLVTVFGSILFFTSAVIYSIMGEMV